MRYRFRLLVMACLMLLLLPCRAHASTLVGSYEIPTDADVVACDFLGYDYNTMDSGLRSLLFNSNVGGGTGTDANPNFAGYAAFRDSLYSPALLGDYQWYSRYDGFMFVNAADKARADIEGAVRWWNEYGNEAGSGSGPEIDGDYTVFDIPAYYFTYNGANLKFRYGNTNYTFVNNNNYGYTLAPANAQLKILTSILPDNITSIVLNFNNTTYNIYITTNPLNNVQVVDNYQQVVTYESIAGSYDYYSGSVTIDNIGNSLEATCSSLRHTSWTVSSGIRYGIEAGYILLDSSGGSGGGSGGNNGGPVPPETPKTPEVDEKPNYNTDINVNGTINVDNSSTGATEFELDLSELLDILKTINDNLVAFAEDMHSMWDWWAEEMGVIESDIRKVQDAISTWLQMIYERLASIGSPNPTTQPTSWLDWLRALLSALVGDLPSSIGGIQQSLSALQRLFPFSIPWDLAVLLGLFVSSPVTPVFDLPFPYSANGVAYIHVDCSQWNGIMSAVRSVELVIFAAALALRTRELIKGVEVE